MLNDIGGAYSSACCKYIRELNIDGFNIFNGISVAVFHLSGDEVVPFKMEEDAAEVVEETLSSPVQSDELMALEANREDDVDIADLPAAESNETVAAGAGSKKGVILNFNKNFLKKILKMLIEIANIHVCDG